MNKKQVNPIQVRIELESIKLTKLEDAINLIESFANKYEIEYKTRQTMPSTIYRIEFDTKYDDKNFRLYIDEVAQTLGGLTNDKLQISEDNSNVTQHYSLNICKKNI